VGGVTGPTRFPNLVTSSSFADSVERLGFPQETPRTRALSLGLSSGWKFSRLPASIGRPGLTMDAACVAPSDGRPLTHHTAADRCLRTSGAASRIARGLRAYGLRPGVGAAVKSAARPSEALLPFVSFLLSLPDRQRILPRSHSKGSTFFIARARFWEGCLDVDCFTPTPNQPNQLILSLTSPGRSSIPPNRPTCIFID